ncbi:SI1L3 protein, partial [Cettia cetti]|nr:SI1L3 protein [Cettia cetti]
MGVRARVAEWPPRPKAPPGAPRSPSRAPRRPAPRPTEAESREGFAAAPLRQRSSSEVTLSECDAEETPESRGGNCGLGSGLFREYGSTSSIDVQGIPEQSFFDMLNEFRAKKPEFGAAKTSENREELQQCKEKPRRRCLKNDESIFKKLRNPRHEAEPKDGEDPARSEAGKSWIWRKSFAHFDVQSMLFEAASLGAAGTQRRNTTTGASAASAGSDPASSSTEDLNSKENLEQDLGDNTSNELLLSCPHFRNEIGGGSGERDVSFSRSAPAFPADPGFWGEFGQAGRGSNAGVALLEVPKEQRRNPERLRAYGVEHADLGARYYRDYFHGKGLHGGFG